uniref:GSVIVT01015850001 n=1 Tax=Arundo donax TaxID=35708 RepID=A0A0A9G024_ARUDO
MNSPFVGAFPHQLPCLFCVFYKIIKAVINDLEVTMEIALPWNYPFSQRKIPIGDVKCGPVLSFEKSSILDYRRFLSN